MVDGVPSASVAASFPHGTPQYLHQHNPMLSSPRVTFQLLEQRCTFCSAERDFRGCFIRIATSSCDHISHRAGEQKGAKRMQASGLPNCIRDVQRINRQRTIEPVGFLQPVRRTLAVRRGPLLTDARPCKQSPSISATFFTPGTVVSMSRFIRQHTMAACDKVRSGPSRSHPKVCALAASCATKLSGGMGRSTPELNAPAAWERMPMTPMCRDGSVPQLL